MADINAAWPAKLLHNTICAKTETDNEVTWVEQQFSNLSVRQQEKWSLNRIRKYLLGRFCEPRAVELKISEIAVARYEKSIKTGIPMRV